MCRKIIGIAALAVAVLMATQTVWAADGVWSSTAATGTWSTTTNWLTSIVATGAGSTADFNQIDVPASGINVSVDGTPIIGNLIFGDTNTSTAGGWLLTDGGSGYLYMEAASGAVPSITVNGLGGTSVAEIRMPLYGSLGQGLNKLGSGTLVLSVGGVPILGGTTVNAGTLRLTGGDNMLDTLSRITVNGTLDLGGFSQTSSAVVTTTATPPVTTSGIILNGNVQNGTLVNTGIDPSTFSRGKLRCSKRQHISKPDTGPRQRSGRGSNQDHRRNHDPQWRQYLYRRNCNQRRDAYIRYAKLDSHYWKYHR